MKKFVICMVFLLLGQSIAIPSLKMTLPSKRSQLFQQVEEVKGLKAYPLCGTCIQFAGQFINALLNIILNAGVVGGCSDLCGLLPASNAEKEICELLCSIVGIEEFIKIIEKADLDPIYYCELLKTCEIKDDGDATIRNITVTPNPIPKGSDFVITFTFSTINGTGTGEVIIQINTQDGIPLGSSNLMKPVPANQQVSGTLKGTAAPDPDCDPTQGPCELWLPGNYSVQIAVCNGQCGSKHPHSQIYDEKTVPFTVVN